YVGIWHRSFVEILVSLLLLLCIFFFFELIVGLDATFDRCRLLVTNDLSSSPLAVDS
ncbi:unnamed protein product, partial [Rotaria magnacalcarata]